MKKLKRLWIPFIGWTLAYGVFHNCVITPFFGVTGIEWSSLVTMISLFLGISGARDIGIKFGDKNNPNSPSE